MSEFGVIASRFNSNTNSLRDFDEALRFMKNKKEVKKDTEISKLVDNILRVIHPIADSVKSILSETTAITDRSVYRILKERHHHDWADYKRSILELESKLTKDEINLSQLDFDLLNDIADALDAECTDLFQRMGDRR